MSRARLTVMLRGFAAEFRPSAAADSFSEWAGPGRRFMMLRMNPHRIAGSRYRAKKIAPTFLAQLVLSFFLAAWVSSWAAPDLKSGDPELPADLVKSAEGGDPAAALEVHRLLTGTPGHLPDWNRARKALEAALPSKDPKVQAALGAMYVDAPHKREDLRTGAKMLSDAAHAGVPEALIKLGYCFETGKGAGRDPEKAIACYDPVARQGNGRALIALGRMYLRGAGVEQDFDTARRLFEDAVTRGEPEGNCHLAELYLLGAGGPPDIPKGVELVRAGAEAGTAECQLRLGRFYLNGSYVQKDPEEAFKWINRAAEQGNVEAMNELGRLYGSGNGTPFNALKAIEWFQAAADAGNAEAWRNLVITYRAGAKIPILPDDAFDKWLKRVLDGDNAEGMITLGQALLKGSAGGGDGMLAYRVFERAGELGDPRGTYSCGEILFQGLAGPRDSDRGSQLILEAAKKGLPVAVNRAKELALMDEEAPIMETPEPEPSSAAAVQGGEEPNSGASGEGGKNTNPAGRPGSGNNANAEAGANPQAQNTPMPETRRPSAGASVERAQPQAQ